VPKTTATHTYWCIDLTFNKYKDVTERLKSYCLLNIIKRAFNDYFQIKHNFLDLRFSRRRFWRRDAYCLCYQVDACLYPRRLLSSDDTLFYWRTFFLFVAFIESPNLSEFMTQPWSNQFFLPGFDLMSHLFFNAFVSEWVSPLPYDWKINRNLHVSAVVLT
jgi:hypothetical protein